MKIPKAIIVNTGDQHKVQKTIDDFFMEIIDSLLPIANIKNKFTIESGEISIGNIITDRRISYIAYQEKILGGVLETRTEQNYVQYSFFLSPEFHEINPQKQI